LDYLDASREASFVRRREQDVVQLARNRVVVEKVSVSSGALRFDLQ
jgi:hypothetical protein